MSTKRICNFEPVDLIDAVEMRPCIWDKRIDDYKDRTARDKAWIEICCILKPSFNEMEHGEKKKFEDVVVEKWKNIRDAFSKSLKKKTGDKYKKKYLYHEQLLFLLAILEKAETEESFYSNAEEGSESCENSSQIDTDKGDDNIEIHKQRTSKKRKGMDDADKAIIKALENSQTPSQRELDEDEAFFSSILPSVRRLSPDDKLQFRVEVMQLLQRKLNAVHQRPASASSDFSRFSPSGPEIVSVNPAPSPSYGYSSLPQPRNYPTSSLHSSTHTPLQSPNPADDDFSQYQY